jgi:hypothetical protein
MIYSSSLKTLLRERFSYDEERDAFINITSKYMPLTSDFMLFWEKTITVIEESNIEDEEFEMDEICSLFKKWVVVPENASFCLTCGNINEHEAVKLITHFFPNVEIIENKYLLNVRCSMWNKLNDIQQALDAFRTMKQCEKVLESVSEFSLVSLDNVYQFYCTHCNKNKKRIASKRYFEKYVSTILATHILFEKFISNEWFL